jgi:DNA-directed RNA polymerase specialized sigma24 family protein
MRARLDASNLVQSTSLKAAREFPRFLGSAEPELTAWLRQILVRTLANEVKAHRARRRDYRREEPFEALLDSSSLAIQEQLAAPVASPAPTLRGPNRPFVWLMR